MRSCNEYIAQNAPKHTTLHQVRGGCHRVYLCMRTRDISKRGILSFRHTTVFHNYKENHITYNVMYDLARVYTEDDGDLPNVLV